MPFYVYVIDLDPKVLQSKKFRERNPGYVEGKPCVYVGQTYLTPEKRFDNHKQGHKPNRYVKKHGRYLRRKNFEKYNPIKTREKALELEEMLALKLQSKGYAVWWN